MLRSTNNHNYNTTYIYPPKSVRTIPGIIHQEVNVTIICQMRITK